MKGWEVRIVVFGVWSLQSTLASPTEKQQVMDVSFETIAAVAASVCLFI